ncbi:hypothetical protein GCM10010519_73600 [Streptomyces lactacystinicus]
MLGASVFGVPVFGVPVFGVPVFGVPVFAASTLGASAFGTFVSRCSIIISRRSRAKVTLRQFRPMERAMITFWTSEVPSMIVVIRT